MADVIHRPPPNNPRVAKAIMSYTSDTRLFQNILHFSAGSPWTAVQLDTLATDIIAWWNTFYKVRMSSDVALSLVQTRKLDPSNPLGVDKPVIPPIPGQQGSSSTPSNATVTMSFRTGLAGRRFRGRIYVPGIVATDVSTVDQINSALGNSLLLAGLQLISGAITYGFPTVFHAPNVTPSTFDNTFNDITTIVIETLLDSMRSRLPGRGR